MKKYRIFVLALLGLLAATLLGGCALFSLGGGIDTAATPNPPAVFPEVPSLQDFNTIGGYMAAVEAYPARLDAAHDGAVTEAAANRDRKVAKADAKFEVDISQVRENLAAAEAAAETRAKHVVGAAANYEDVTFDEAVAKAKNVREMDRTKALSSARKSYDEAEKSRNDAVSKAKADFANTKGKLATEMQQRIDATAAERELVASFGSVDDLQDQIDALQQRIADLEQAAPAPVATPCITQPAFTG